MYRRFFVLLLFLYKKNYYYSFVVLGINLFDDFSTFYAQGLLFKAKFLEME